jgi:hypothetical protein
MLPRKHEPVVGSSELLAKLAGIRRRRRWMFALFVGFLPAAAAVETAAGSRELVFLFGAAWLVATAVVGLWTTYTPCPSCSSPFFSGSIASHFWAPRCGHCGQDLKL